MRRPVLALLVAFLGCVDSAQATFPGQNGQLAFGSRDPYELYCLAPDGSAVTKLPVATGVEQNPVWSPDGNRLAFTASTNAPSELWTMHADGSGAQPLVADGTSAIQPTWSPDGTK